VVAGVSIDASRISQLKELGVRDSKTLSAKKRESLYPQIINVAEHVHWTWIPPNEIDRVVMTGRRLRKLNYLEAVYFARIIDKLAAEKVTVDASDVIPGRFRDDIRANMNAKCRVVATHKADRHFPVVSAASIIAKVERDRAVARLRDEHGDFGSGYPSDPITRAFFIDWMGRGEPLPGYVRKSWKTWVNLEQTLIDSF